MSDTRLLGVLAADRNGTFTSTVEIPADVADGTHTLQVNGYTSRQQVRRMSLGVTLISPTVVSNVRGSRVVFGYKSDVLTSAAKRSLKALVAQVPRGADPITVSLGAVRASGATRADRVLAQKRASRVARYLRAQGLTGAIRVRIQSIPVTNRAQDRRVDVTIRFTSERIDVPR